LQLPNALKEVLCVVLPLGIVHEVCFRKCIWDRKILCKMEAVYDLRLLYTVKKLQRQKE